MGKPVVWGQSPQRGPGQSPWSEGQGAKPPEAESFSVVGCSKEVENVLQFYDLFISQQNVLSCIGYIQQCCGEVSLGDRL